MEVESYCVVKLFRPQRRSQGVAFSLADLFAIVLSLVHGAGTIAVPVPNYTAGSAI